MPEETTHKTLVVANLTASTPALLKELERRAAAGGTTFTLLIPPEKHADAHDWTQEDAVEMVGKACGGPVDCVDAGDDAGATIKRLVEEQHVDAIVLSTEREHHARVVRAAIAVLGTSQTRLAPLLGVNTDKTVRDWCSARMTPPRGALRALRLMLERVVDPPPEELLLATNRAAPCAAALGPHLDELTERAETAGWTDREVAEAVRAWVASRAGR